MINPNVQHAVGEAIEAHGVTARPGERMADTVSRALHITGAQAERWLAALDAGRTVEEANLDAGVKDESALVALARAIGKALGSLA